MTTPIAPICISCTRFLAAAAPKLQCLAYPGGVPSEIWDSKVDHRKPYEGDHGLQFQQDAESPEPLQFGDTAYPYE